MMSREVTVGIVGLGGLQLAAYYESVAPSLQSMRESDPGEDRQRQHLMDANLQAGFYAVMLGVLMYAVTGSTLPLVVFVGVVAASATWRCLVLYSERF